MLAGIGFCVSFTWAKRLENLWLGELVVAIQNTCLILHNFFFVCFSLPVFSEGIYWMNIVSVKHIYCCSNRVIEVFSLNHLCDFWALSRCSVTSLSLVTCRGKSTRVMAIGNDSRFVNYYFFCPSYGITGR